MKKTIFLMILLTLNSSLIAAEAMNILLIPSSVRTAYLPLPERVQDASRFELLYSQWLYDSYVSSFGWQNGQSLLQARLLQSGDIEIRGEQPVDEPVATTDYFSGALTYGHWLDYQDWRFYAAACLLYERLWYASAFGGAADLILSRNVSEKITFTAGARHLGQMNVLDEDATPLPMRFFGGGSYMEKHFSLAAYGQMNRHQETGFVLHSSVNLLDAAELNISYSSFEKAVMAGAALLVNEWTLGFSFVWFQENLQNPLFFSVQR